VDAAGANIRASARARKREREREREGSGTSLQLQQLGAARCDYEGRVEGEFSTLRCVKVLTRFSGREGRGGWVVGREGA